MSDVIIRAEGLGKKFRIQHQQPERYSTLRDVLAQAVMKPFHLRRKSTNKEQAANPISPAMLHQSSLETVEDFWALRDVSFQIKQGEVIGIIGRNGAGKSTLLKILSRITEPTEGRVTLWGRVASLLEVGTGFHPELTGRENVYLNGAILGMSRAEIKRKFDEIVAFAEVEKFLDTPVKRYSSGMYVRLAFAVAAHLEPEILIVDEVLAVGDTEFQKKCLGKMSEVATGGRTVLFVSHNLAAVRALCSTGIVLEKGRVKIIAPVMEATASYLADHAPMGVHYVKAASMDEKPEILEVRVHASSTFGRHSARKPLRLEIAFRNAGLSDLMVGLHIYSMNDTQVVQSSSEFAPPAEMQSACRLTVSLPGDLLNVGRYRCELVLGRRNVEIYDRIEGELGFEIEDPDFQIAGTYANDWKGILSPRGIEWTWGA